MALHEPPRLRPGRIRGAPGDAHDRGRPRRRRHVREPRPAGRRAARARRAAPGLGGRRATRSSPAGNAARWTEGVLLHVPAGVTRRGAAPRGARADRRGIRALPPRAGGRRARRARHVHRGVLLGGARLPERGRRAQGRRRRAPRVRDDPEPPRRDAPVRHAPRHGRPRREPRLDRRGDGRDARQVADGELPRRPRGLGQGDRGVLPQRPRARRLRHHPGARGARHDLRPRVQGRPRRAQPGRLARASSASTGARRRPTPTRRTATSCFRPTRRRRRSRASRSRPTTSVAPTAPPSARSTSSTSST